MTTESRTIQPERHHGLNRRTLLVQAAAAGLAAPALASIVAPSVGASNVASRAVPAANTTTDSLQATLAAGVKQGIPCVALQVESAGKTVFSGAAGVANIEQKTPLKATDRFRIYSIAKTFTATVVLQLVDEGVLTLKDTVTHWLTDSAVLKIPNVDEITLRELLNHSSGIYDFADDRDSQFWVDAFLGPNADWAKVWTIDELLAYADGANHDPYFEPGTSVYYSNTDYLLLGLIVETATDNSYAKELQTRILTPLKLADTFLAEGAAMPDDVVSGYQVIEGELTDVSISNLSWIWTAGGMVSTTADLARFAQATFSGDLMSAASFKEMFTFVDNPSKPGFAEGMGVYRAPSDNGVLIGMDGQGPGFTSSMMRLSEGDINVVTLVNIAPDEGAGDGIRDAAFKAASGSA
jgi:D-alanyl-D-alanine carboxypeptidase